MTLLGCYSHRGVHRFREHANILDGDLICVYYPVSTAPAFESVSRDSRCDQMKARKKYRLPKNHFIVPCQEVASARMGSVTQTHKPLRGSCAKKVLLMSLKTWKTSTLPQ